MGQTPPPPIGARGIVRSLPHPSDQPPQMTCWQAKMVASQARDNLAQPPGTVDVKHFADTTLDWLDPHGLWSISSDSPINEEVKKYAYLLLASLQTPNDDRGC
ncbi:MAG: hypothetical protein CSA75_05725, partial [Sorangium cellulosum]